MADGELQKDFLPQPVLIFTLKYHLKRRVLKRTTSPAALFPHKFYVSGNVVQIQTAKIKQTACNKKEEKTSLSIYNLTGTYSVVSNLFYALFLCRIEWVLTSRIKQHPMLNLKLLQLSIPESAV